MACFQVFQSLGRGLHRSEQNTWWLICISVTNKDDPIRSSLMGQPQLCHERGDLYSLVSGYFLPTFCFRSQSINRSIKWLILLLRNFTRLNKIVTQASAYCSRKSETKISACALKPFRIESERHNVWSTYFGRAIFKISPDKRSKHSRINWSALYMYSFGGYNRGRDWVMKWSILFS